MQADALGVNGDQSVGKEDRPLGLVLRRPNHDGDSGDGFDELLARADASRLGALDLPFDPQCAGEDVVVADLDADASPRRSARGRVQRSAFQGFR